MAKILQNSDVAVLSDSYQKDFNRLYEIVEWNVSSSVRRIELEEKNEFEERRRLDKHFVLGATAKRIFPTKSYALDGEIEIRIYPMKGDESPNDEPIGFLGVSITLDFPMDIIAQIATVMGRLNFLYVLADIPDETFREAHIYRADFQSSRDKTGDDFDFTN